MYIHMFYKTEPNLLPCACPCNVQHKINQLQASLRGLVWVIAKNVKSNIVEILFVMWIHAEILMWFKSCRTDTFSIEPCSPSKKHMNICNRTTKSFNWKRIYLKGNMSFLRGILSSTGISGNVWQGFCKKRKVSFVKVNTMFWFESQY